MTDLMNKQNAVPLARRTTAHLRLIARALRERADTGRFPRRELAREIARIGRLIESRQDASLRSSPRRSRQAGLIASR